MTIVEVWEQAKTLSLQDRKELAKLLIDSLDLSETIPQSKTGAEIAAMLEQMEPIEFVDSYIEDPVEWVKAQRREQEGRLKPH